MCFFGARRFEKTGEGEEDDTDERSESRVEDTLFEPQSSRSRAYGVAAVAVAVSVLAVVAVVTRSCSLH